MLSNYRRAREASTRGFAPMCHSTKECCRLGLCSSWSTKLETTSSQPVIVIHGGTSGLGLSKEAFKVREKVMIKSLKAGEKVLAKGGAAIDAVIAAIKVMENSPEFNAGKGAVFTSEGVNELDASIMCGATKKAGAVAMSRHIKNPIEGARIVMEKTWHTLIAGEGADNLAKKYGLDMVSQKYYFTQRRWDQLQKAKKEAQYLLDSGKVKAALDFQNQGDFTEPYLGTVGAAAYDSRGNVAAGTSTGGMTNKMNGRIGDSPIIGAGTYADNGSVALSCTGTGDVFIRAAVAHNVSALYKYKKLDFAKAGEISIAEVEALGGSGGVIGVDRYGNTGYAWSKTKLGMFHGEMRVGGKAKVFWPVES